MACLVGTSIEWYDFFICGTASALYPKLFFPSFDPAASIRGLLQPNSGPKVCSGSKTRIAVQRPDVGFRRLRTRLTFKPTQPSVAQVEVSCPAEGEQRSGHSGLCFPQFAFSNDARIRFFQILDAIFELALILWEPLGHLVGFRLAHSD
jgi:hypothetical protein